MMDEDTRDLLRAILDGEWDEDLDVISEGLRERRKVVRDREARLNRVALRPGDRVRLKGLSPNYLNDAIVEVVEVRRTRVSVKPVDGVTLGRAATRIHLGSTVPLSCVEVVDD